MQRDIKSIYINRFVQHTFRINEYLLPLHTINLQNVNMPRLSIRKLFIYLLAVASCLLLALNIHQRTVGLFTTNTSTGRKSSILTKHSVVGANGPSGITGPSSAGGSDPLFLVNSGQRAKPEGNQKSIYVPTDSLLDPSDKTIPEPDQRPWYMRDGKIRPTFKEDEQDIQLRNRDSRIFPDEF